VTAWPCFLQGTQRLSTTSPTQGFPALARHAKAQGWAHVG
jgi:hypothetical protein